MSLGRATVIRGRQGRGAREVVWALVAIGALAGRGARGMAVPDEAAILAAQKRLLGLMVQEAAKEGDGRRQATAYECVCRAQVALGDIAGAFNSALKVPPAQVDAFWEIIAGTPRGRVDAAGRALLEQLPEEYRVPPQVVEQVLKGDIEGAFEKISKVKAPELRLAALGRMASQLTELRKLDALRQLEEWASRKWTDLPANSRASLAKMRIETLARGGHAKAALTLVNENFADLPVGDMPFEPSLSEIARSRPAWIFNVARWQTLGGDLDAGKVTAELLGPARQQTFEEYNIAYTEMKLALQAGDWAKVQQVLATGKFDFQSERMLYELRGVRAGDWDGAQRVFEPYRDTLEKANRYLELALRWARAGYADAARKAIAEALGREDAPPEYSNTHLRTALLAAAWMLLGDEKAAAAAAEDGARDAGDRCSVLWEAFLALDYSARDSGMRLPEAVLYEVYGEGVDEALIPRVRELVGQLDAEGAEDREAAQRELEGLGPAAKALLLRMDMRGFSEEQKARVGQLLDMMRPLPAEEVAKRRRDYVYLMQGLLAEDRRLRVAALRELEAVEGHAVAFDVEGDYSARLRAWRKLRGL